MNRSPCPARRLAPLAALALAGAALATPAAAADPASGLDASLDTPARETPATVIGSYGEINVNRPISSAAETVADLRRFVISLQHRFTPELKMVAEVEIEHAVSSADDAGEVEVEQAFIERQLGATWAVQAGLVLMPIGLLNEHHEPTVYYGVERNFVETAIIPSTWREGAVQVVGSFDNGLTVQGGVGTSFDLGKWDAASTEGAESPLGSVHQELQLARARDLGGFAAVNWRGVPGLQLGGAAFVGGGAQGTPGLPTTVVSLWDLHARWTPGPFDLSALYARGHITHTAELNAPLVGGTLIPETFDGWYVQGAWHAWAQGGLALAPFVRYEQFNTGRSYADLGPALTPEARPTEGVTTVGVNFYLSPEVVVKADYQYFQVEHTRSRVDFGLGWSF